LMLGVEAGGDRQQLHEVVRRNSRAVQEAMASGEVENDLLERLAAEPQFAAVDVAALRAELDPMLYVGRARQQVVEFVEGPVADMLESLTHINAPDEATVTL